MKVLGVKFRNSAKVYYFSPDGHDDLERGDFVIVKTARGQEAGTVAFAPREMSEEDVPNRLKSILRPATALDLTEMERYQQREWQTLHRCRQKVADRNLAMKVILAQYNFDGTHLTFHFCAEKRVDFRSLVKDLARAFKARIELRQVGVRDEVRLLGGYGLCGRPHCCSMWLSDFRPISIRMAKNQNLPLSPMEISGVCGRLLCCLAYENDFYAKVKKGMPKMGRTVETPSGSGRVIGLNVLDDTVTVSLSGQTAATFPSAEVKPGSAPEEGTSRGRQDRRKRG